MSKATKTVRISENELVDLIDNIVSEAVKLEKQKALNESKAVKKEAVKAKPKTKKVVKISESELIDLIDNIVSEAVNIKKKEWLSEQSKNQ